MKRHKFLHSTPACNLPSIMQHGLLAYPDALVTWKDNKDADLIRSVVNLWCPLNAWEMKHGLRHWNNDPHVVLDIDWTPARVAETPEGSLVALFRRYSGFRHLGFRTSTQEQLSRRSGGPFLLANAARTVSSLG